MLGCDEREKKKRRNLKIAPIILFEMCCCTVALESTHTKTDKTITVKTLLSLSWQESEYNSHWGKTGPSSHHPGSFLQNNPLGLTD